MTKPSVPKTGASKADASKTGASKIRATRSRKKTTSPAKQEAQERYALEPRLENEPLTKYLEAALAKSLKTHLGMTTVGEFLEYYPRKYLPRGELSSFSDLVEGSEVTLIAKVLSVSTRQMKARRGSITEIVITDQLESTGNPGAWLGSETGRASESLIPEQHVRSDYRFVSEGHGAPNTSNPRITGLASGYSDSYGEAPYSGFDSGALFGNYSTNAFGEYAQDSTMTLSFFNAWTAAREIHTGDHVMFSGKVGAYRGAPTLTNPHYAVLADTAGSSDSGTPEAIEKAKTRANAPIAVYKASSKLPTDRIATAMETLLDAAPLKDLEDPIPPAVRRQRKIPSLAWTYRGIHTPDSEETWRAAQHFLRYREAFILQSALARIRAVRSMQATTARPFHPGGFADRLLELLPYELTEGQAKVGEQISADLASHVPMNRLLQGDVGSGKTVVALKAMLQVADNGAQAAMLAPTEVLAEQHYRSVCEILGALADTSENPLEASSKQMNKKVRVVLLKASMPTRVKKQTLLEIASGVATIIIGTHALLADAVKFADLGMVVVDEQHRFGVEQRDALRGSDGGLPHRLVMTATPIPRTVAMTVFGDLDTSVLDQLPAGRQKIQTVVVPLKEHPTWEKRLWQRAREEIDAGHQVYVVVPKIGGGDSEAATEDGEVLFADTSGQSSTNRASELNSVASMLEELQSTPSLSGVRIAALHGRMDTAEKSEIMQNFSDGLIDLLVCTTVIEVGVNVPNATLMVIMDADRFGISGLHQLRGRIGRGSLPGTCLLVTTQPEEGVSRERLAAVASTTDGFELSRIDLEQRREGDILGAAQSGNRSTLKLLRALTDARLIEKAREDARAVVDADPTLAKHPDLARTIDRALDADREAFLGRG